MTGDGVAANHGVVTPESTDADGELESDPAEPRRRFAEKELFLLLLVGIALLMALTGFVLIVT